MIRIHEKLILSVFLITLSQGLYAQTPKPYFVLTAPDTLRHRTYVARNYVLLKPGFNYKAQNGTDAFYAKTDPTLNFNITYIPNPTPGDTTNANIDDPYVPGNSFNSDVIRDIPGIKDDMTKPYGQQAEQTPRIYPIFWFKTMPVTNNLNGAYHWVDVMGNNSSLLKRKTSNSWVEYVSTRDKVRSFNFNPAADLSNDMSQKKVAIATSNLAQATIMGVWGVKSGYAGDQSLMSIQGRKNDWVLATKKFMVHSKSTITDLVYGGASRRNFMTQASSLDGTDTTLFHEKAFRVGTFYKSSVPEYSVWGESQDAAIYLGTRSDTVQQWQSYIGMNGYIPELLIFNQQISPKSIHIYSTYLGVKYGVTLDTSYISASGEVIWNYQENTGYNNRITGYGREDALGLMQKVSTTSYEEKPYYAELATYDSNDSTDSYHPSSRYRLLTMGLQPANPINDERYVLYGDNAGSLTIKGDSLPSFSKVLARKWKLQTNTCKDGVPTKALSWTAYGQNLAFGKKYNTNIYRGDITKSASNDSAAIVTSTALKGKDGYLAWTVDIEFGPVTAKFGPNTPFLGSNTHDYGYRIEIDGQVHQVYKGQVSAYSLFTVETGQRLEIEKTENSVYLKVDGVRYKNTEFMLDTADISKSYFGAVIMGGSQYDFKLVDFRHGGFVNTGHRIELSYDANRAALFTNPCVGNIYLLIDPSSQGNFTGALTEYPCDEMDATRKKVIFNNVFWEGNPDGNYFFTFAYKNNVTLRTAENVPEEIDGNAKDDIQVISRDETLRSTITVRVKTAELTPVSIYIFDLAGRRIDRRSLPASHDVSYSDFKLPSTGLYIIKIITKTNHYTKEVVSK